jgi:hypothetical protein
MPASSSTTRGGYMLRPNLSTTLGVAQKKPLYIAYSIFLIQLCFNRIGHTPQPKFARLSRQAISLLFSSPHVLGPGASLPHSFPSPSRPSALTPRAPVQPPPNPRAAAAPVLLRACATARQAPHHTCWSAAMLRCAPTPPVVLPHLRRGHRRP